MSRVHINTNTPMRSMSYVCFLSCTREFRKCTHKLTCTLVVISSAYIFISISYRPYDMLPVHKEPCWYFSFEFQLLQVVKFSLCVCASIDELLGGIDKHEYASTQSMDMAQGNVRYNWIARSCILQNFVCLFSILRIGNSESFATDWI